MSNVYAKYVLCWYCGVAWEAASFEDKCPHCGHGLIPTTYDTEEAADFWERREKRLTRAEAAAATGDRHD